MSLIFDALQRSEAEHSGVDVSALPAADVLRLAELRTLSERAPGVSLKQPDAAPCVVSGTESSAERGAPLLWAGAARVATAVESPLVAELSSIGSGRDVFDQFQPFRVSVSPENRLVCLSDGDSLAAEKFRFLGVRLQQLRRDRPLKKVLVTSTIPQEGKSMVSANLACALARRTQQRVLLVEGDVRRPALSGMFGLGKLPGICEWLQGERNLSTSVYRLEGPDLWILPSGSATKNPLELFQAVRLSAVLDELTALFDWVIVDSPPVLPLADTSVWMRLADGILLVARQGITQKKQLQKGLETVESKKLIGALLNASKTTALSDYYYAPVQR